MAGQLIRADVGSSNLRARTGGWPWSGRSSGPGEIDPWDRDDGWRAVLGIRRGLKLRVSGRDGQPGVLVAAWAGEPGDDTDGVAVVVLAGGGLALARVPLCGCGVRGCGNAGVQLRKVLPGRDLPELAGLLRALPWTPAAPVREDVLRGEGLAALPEGPAGRTTKVVYRGAATVEPVWVPVTVPVHLTLADEQDASWPKTTSSPPGAHGPS